MVGRLAKRKKKAHPCSTHLTERRCIDGGKRLCVFRGPAHEVRENTFFADGADLALPKAAMLGWPPTQLAEMADKMADVVTVSAGNPCLRLR